MEREEELENLGFTRKALNYELSKYGQTWFVPIYKLLYEEKDWQEIISNLKREIEAEKKLNRFVLWNKKAWLVVGIILFSLGMLAGFLIFALK